MSITDEIKKLKTEKNAVILAHNYQPKEIQDLADILGDSLELAREAKKTDADIIVLCGVMFMAETAKILNPTKKVLIPAPNAGCKLADYVNPAMIKAERKAYPDAEVVLYVNSTAESKAEADITCTSSNAVAVCKSLKSKRILFGPDSNLASWVGEQLPEKEIIPLPYGGCCPVHAEIKPETAREAKAAGYKVICHPECPKAVRDECDVVASTGGMLKEAVNGDKWAVLTERDMTYRLKCKYPDKEFKRYESAFCENMKLITPEILRNSLRDETTEVVLSDALIKGAGKAIERMLNV